MQTSWHCCQPLCHQLTCPKSTCSRSIQRSINRRPDNCQPDFNGFRYVWHIPRFTLISQPHCLFLSEVDEEKLEKAAEPLGKIHHETVMNLLLEESEQMRSQIVRLSAALLQTTFAQTELGINSDLTMMCEWAAKFNVFASQQAVPNFFHIQLCVFTVSTCNLALFFFLLTGWTGHAVPGHTL